MLHWLALLPLAVPSVVVNVGALSELRLRAPGDPGADRQLEAQSYDVDTTVTAVARMDRKPYTFTLTYSPLLGVSSFTDPDPRNRQLQLAHTLSGAVGVAGRRSTTTLTDVTTVGYRRFSALTGSTVDGFEDQVLPVSVTVGFLNTSLTLRHSYQLNNRHSASVEAGFRYARWLDETSSQIVPVSYGPSASFGYRYALSAANDIGFDLSGRRTTTRPTELSVQQGRFPWLRTTTYQSNLVWSHQLLAPRGATSDTRGARFSVFVGASISQTEDPTGMVWLDPVPVGGADLSGVLGHEFALGKFGKLNVGFTAAMLTAVDRVTSQPEQRLTAVVRSGWTKAEVNILASAGVVRGVDASFNLVDPRSRFASLEGRYSLTRQLFFRGGARVALVSTSVATANTASSQVSDTQWVGFVGLGLQLDPFRL